MRIVSKHIDKNGDGKITLIPEEDEDFWHLYNLISKGDAFRAKTFRKVVSETKTGSVSSEKKLISVMLRITDISYYSDDHI